MADLSVKLPKPKYGQVVVLQKNGDEPRGHGFPLISTSCVVGRSLGADIRISSADVSLTHCKFLIDEVSGEASLEVHGQETEINETYAEPASTVKLNHRDVVLVGGRKLRFEYLPPDYKPLPSKQISGVSSDSFHAEVVDLEENGDVVVDSHTEKEEEVLAEVQCTPAGKRVSFGPYLSPEQFDNTLPPATPIRKGATPRRSTRYSGLKFSRPPIDPLVEEETVVESPLEEVEPVTEGKECVVDETIISEEADVSVSGNLVVPVSDTVIGDSSPSLGIGPEYADLANAPHLEMSMDAMSTLSDVSNIAAVPSECCSFLDEPIEEDEFGPEVVDQEDGSLTPMGETCLFSDDLMAVPAAMATSHLTNGSELLRSFATSSLTGTLNEEDEGGITLSPEDMSEVKNRPHSMAESSTGLEEAPVAAVDVEMIPSSPAAHQSDIGSVVELTPTPINQSLPADGQSSADASIEDVAQVIEPIPAVVVERVEQVDMIMNADMDTRESSPAKGASAAASPMVPLAQPANESCPTIRLPMNEASHPVSVPVVDASADVEPVARREATLETSRPMGRTAPADPTDVRGVQTLWPTPKPAPDAPIADEPDVEGVDLLMKTPKVEKDVTPLVLVEEEEKECHSHVPIEMAEKSQTIVSWVAEDAETKPSPPPPADEQEKPVLVESHWPAATVGHFIGKEPEEADQSVKEEESMETPSSGLGGSPLIPTDAIQVQPLCKTRPGQAVDVKMVVESIDVKEMESIDVKEMESIDVNEMESIDVKEMESIDVKEMESIDVKEMESIEVKEMESMVNTSEPNEVASPTNDDELVPEMVEQAAQSPLPNAKDISLELSEKNVVVGVPVIDDQPVKEAGTDSNAVRRGRRATTTSAQTSSSSSSNTPQSDDRDVTAVVLPETHQVDGCHGDGADGLTKTSPETRDALVQKDEQEKEVVLASDVEPSAQASNEEPKKEMATEKPVVRRRPGRRAGGQPASSTRPPNPRPATDGADVSGLRRLFKTPKTKRQSGQANDSHLEGVDGLMQTPKSTKEDRLVAMSEEVKEEVVSDRKVVAESAADAALEANGTAIEMVGQTDQTPPVDRQVEMVKEKTPAPPRRGRRLAATKPLARETDSDAEGGVGLRMKSPRAMMRIHDANDQPTSHRAVDGSSIVASEATQCVEKEESLVVAQVGAHRPTEKEVDVAHPASASRRPRRTAQVKPDAADDTEVDAVDTVNVAPPTFSADACHEGEMDLTMTESDEEVKTVAVPLAAPEKLNQESTLPAKSSSSGDSVQEEKPKHEPRLDVQASPEAEVEKEMTPPRRGLRAAALKTNTPKAGGRTKRKQSDNQPESNGTPKRPSDQVESPVPPAKVDTPKRSRRGAAPSIQLDTPKSAPSNRGKRRSGSDSGQSDPVDGRRSKRSTKGFEKLTLSPVVRLQRIDLALGANPVEEVASRTGSSSGEEWNETKKVNPVRRGRGRPPKVAKTVDEDKAPLRTAGRKRKAVPAVEETISSDGDDVESVKKTTTRRRGVKNVSGPEEIVPDGKRLRTETVGGKHVTGLDDVEMFHKGKGHAADIHANHMPEESIEVSPTTSTKSGRSTRSKTTLKVHFGAAESAPPSPARTTRSARKTNTMPPVEKEVAIVLDREHDIDALAATVTEEEERLPVKRSRQKKVAPTDDSPAVPAIKRARGGKKATSEPIKEVTPTLAPSSPRRSRRTRNN